MKPKSGQPLKILPPKTEMDFRESFEENNIDKKDFVVPKDRHCNLEI